MEAGISLGEFLGDFPTVKKEWAVAVLEGATKDERFDKSFGSFASEK